MTGARAIAVALAWCLLACADGERFSPWPDAQGFGTFIYLRKSKTGIEAQALDPGGELPVVKLDPGSEPEVVVLAYPEHPSALPIALGALTLATASDSFSALLPSGATVFVLDPAGPSFAKNAPTPAWVSNLRVVVADPCPARRTETVVLGHFRGGGIATSVSLDLDHAIFASAEASWIVTATSATQLGQHPFPIGALDLAPDGKLYAAGEGHLAAVHLDDHRWVVDSDVRDPMPDERTIGLIAEGGGRFLILTQSGVLRRYDGTWTQLPSLDPTLTGGGGQLRRLSDGRIAAVNCSSPYAVLITQDQAQVVDLVASEIGVCAIELDPTLGLVIGTAGGEVRAASTGYAALPEVPTHEQRGSSVRAILRTRRELLLYIGHSGTFGEITGGRVCKYTTPGGWTGHVLNAVGTQVIATGFTLDAIPDLLSLTRIFDVN